MMRKTDRLKPAVSKRVLLLLAGLIWFGVGTMLLVWACSWLSDVHRSLGLLYAGIGIAAGFAVHRFGFQKIAAKNIDRIRSMPDKRCVFSVFTWKSYILIIVMITMGRLCRHSSIPKPYLAVIYITMGLALVLSSFKYIRAFVNESKGTDTPSNGGDAQGISNYD